ncbi:hypothetical protein GEMMAAP_03515 [Gemmatimonas phototrophica]|uniref:Glycosyl transferase family 1 domain-containing protein n=2 Tax=Gemmatimonas phototrophica TaxID=1379270 RepID=A0A143BHS1_9BACT|nr:hypothetical protein GEMMAAP_03515 [Gemmatimonas phototrophica]
MEDALLIPPGNAQAMSLAIEKIMGDQVLRSALGSAAHERSRTFNREHYVDELSVMYEQIFEQYCSCTGH